MNTQRQEVIARQRRMRAKGIKYIVLSLLLTTVLLVTTGCAALLFGDSKEAYDRLEKAASYFKYPSSVQIVAGEMSGSTLYCEIKAKNGFGNYRYDTYSISSTGYPSESSSSRCYSSSALNYDGINRALADHFGVSYSSSGNSFSLNYMIGGLENMWVGLIVGLVVALCLNGLLSSKASDMAQDKGYEKKTWFHMCFWLGPISYIIVAAMPDRVMQGKVDQTNKLLEELLKGQKASPATREHAQQADVGSFLPEL